MGMSQVCRSQVFRQYVHVKLPPMGLGDNAAPGVILKGREKAECQTTLVRPQSNSLGRHLFSTRKTVRKVLSLWLPAKC
jgi:hypothetical protein